MLSVKGTERECVKSINKETSELNDFVLAFEHLQDSVAGSKSEEK